MRAVTWQKLDLSIQSFLLLHREQEQRAPAAATAAPAFGGKTTLKIQPQPPPAKVLTQQLQQLD
jgi:hypothetical protein